jgi:Protein of unknown function (DUF2817)
LSDLHFAPDYRAARERLLDLARSAGAALFAYEHPDARGPDGGRLHVDVARLGPAAARKALLVVSGTHGVEGFCGSAAQCAFLADRPAAPPDAAILLVHAINPWGFAHRSRTTENNVDLNRNFVDHARPPANPGYEELHPLLCPPEWSEERLAADEAALEAFATRHGRFALSDALRRGQYTRPDGLFYGGRAPEWSNRLLDRIATEHLAAAERIGFIEWHTGLGGYGEPFFIALAPPGSAEASLAAGWWGAEKFPAEQAFDGAARPNYQGLLAEAMRGRLAPRPVAGAIVEFGTVEDGRPVKRGLRADRWLKFACGDRGGEAARRAEREVMEAFCPEDPAWRRRVIEASRRIHSEALAGVGAW